MTFFSLAVNNIKRKFSSYFTYFISTVFAVTVFNIFCSMYYNDQFANYKYSMGKTGVIFKISTIAVIIFSFIFVSYANKFFMKTRKKEIAVYSLLGMKKTQIGRMLFYENIFIGMLAILCGILLGSLFSKFFAMLLLSMMNAGVDVVFSFEWKAALLTLLVFFILFFLNSINAYSTIYRYKLIELLVASREGESLPKFSVIGAILSIALTLTGYYVALTMNTEISGFKLLLPTMAVLFSVVLGTYLFFKNFVIMMVKKLKKRKSFYYKTNNFISTSQIVYRIKANANMLSVIAVLSAVTITMMCIVYSFYKACDDITPVYSPFSYMCKNVDENLYNKILKASEQLKDVKVLSIDKIKLLNASTQHPQYKHEFSAQHPKYKAESQVGMGIPYDTYVISQSDYLRLVNHTNAKEGLGSNLRTNKNFSLKDNECYFVDSNFNDKYSRNLSGSTLKVNYSGSSYDFKIIGTTIYKYIGAASIINSIVVSDNVYNMFYKSYNEDGIYNFVGLMFDKPNESEDAVTFLNSIVPKENKEISYIEVHQRLYFNYGSTLFICMFLGILFLLTTGSIIYYKQIIEAQEEKERYTILRNIGMHKKEVKRSITNQLAMVFGMPLLLGLLHSLIAMLAFSKALGDINNETSVAFNFFTIITIYVIVYCFYFILCVDNYMKIVWVGKR